ncbi:GyrI-like domain-containing protein [Roseivirga pacifica]|uniref:GyrI-like domain-containing protein n=1 Tax=Roseivirga pacifica TaxID=1267423 RepID=UPI003BAE46A3
MEYRIETMPETKFVGQKALMSLTDNKTVAIWRNFMPKRSEIQNQLGTELYSIEVYSSVYFKGFDPAKRFEKWAAVAVESLDGQPEEMHHLVIPEGKYAVFAYKGSSAEAGKAYQYIFREWLPSSEYELDHRPHFAVMGEKYKNNDPESEEELWVPVKGR